MSQLQILELKKTFDRFKLNVEKICLSNQFYWLSGSNGSGKSVFLRCLAGLEKADSLQIDGSRKNILFLADSEITFPYLTLKENIDLIHRLHRVNQDYRKVKKLFSEGQLDTLAGKASLGMMMKVGCTLAFVQQHWHLIILDETLSNVDAPAFAYLCAELAERAEEGTIVFCVTHNLQPPEGISYTTLCMEEGLLHEI